MLFNDERLNPQGEGRRSTAPEHAEIFTIANQGELGEFLARRMRVEIGRDDALCSKCTQLGFDPSSLTVGYIGDGYAIKIKIQPTHSDKIELVIHRIAIDDRFEEVAQAVQQKLAQYPTNSFEHFRNYCEGTDLPKTRFISQPELDELSSRFVRIHGDHSTSAAQHQAIYLGASRAMLFERLFEKCQRLGALECVSEVLVAPTHDRAGVRVMGVEYANPTIELIELFRRDETNSHVQFLNNTCKKWFKEIGQPEVLNIRSPEIMVEINRLSIYYQQLQSEYKNSHLGLLLEQIDSDHVRVSIHYYDFSNCNFDEDSDFCESNR